MAHPTKIATCCYCSARTMLKPTARGGHELACGACGAPLHEMKWLKLPEPRAPKAAPVRQPRQFARLPNRKRKKRKEPFLRRALEWLDDAWDEVEDIFD
jgi:hypothetical protein